MGGAADNARNRGRLASILLARKARFTDATNGTTATAKSKDGYTMALSFWVADPPQLSLFSVHCSNPPGSRYAIDPSFVHPPRVVGADGPFVLLRAGFYAAAGTREYFLYKAATGDASPSLDRIPSPGESRYDRGDDLRGVREFGILGHGGGGHYLVAALRDAPSSSSDDYQLRIYSSERKSWSTRTLQNPCPGVDRVVPDKVITLGQGGLLGWVDLSHGILACDLLRLQDPDPDPTAAAAGGGVSFFIPLPQPLPGNRYKQKHPIPPAKKMKMHPLAEEPTPSASWFRDITCVNGVLTFIEMENPAPPENEDNTVSDSDLITWLKRKAVDSNSKLQLSSFRDDWRAVTWTRKVSPPSSSPAANCWRQTRVAHVADVKGSEQLVTFRDLYSAFPVLSPADDGNDILYLKSHAEPAHQDGWVAALDLENKALNAIAQYYLPDFWYFNHKFDPHHPFRACTLPRHMDITPGIQVSAFRNTTKASSSADQPSDTSDSGSKEPSSPRSQFQRVFELAEKLRREKNPPESIIQNDHISSQVHPVANNLPPQKFFNKPDGPGYASLALVHGCHNYQPLWPPSKQQSTSSSPFGPHEAPSSRINSFNGGSYHGYYSQQLSAPNSFAYGAYTGYGNIQQQWQQLTPTLEQPIGASWQHPPPPVQRQPTPHEVKTCGMLLF
ncbi:uncharacterized protein [Lolium perenne]|uniref:uncharacterized protein n=1 Tax=Lolium perenne TaxID=4522 RepID=UPI003A9A4C01